MVAFRSAKAAFFRGAKGDTCFCVGAKGVAAPGEEFEFAG
jgi:hypothetical protein